MRLSCSLQWLSLLFAIFLSLPSAASQGMSAIDQIEDPVKLIEHKTKVLLGTLAERKAEFDNNPAALIAFARQEALSHWDFAKTSRLMLGKHWRVASKEQRAKFQEEFLRTMMRYVVRAYGYYDDSLVEVLSYDWQSASKKGTSGWVRSKVKLPASVEVGVDYRMALTLDKATKQRAWKLIDVRVEGISLVHAKRSEYRSVVRDKGMDYLINAMFVKNQKVLGELEPERQISAASSSD